MSLYFLEVVTTTGVRLINLNYIVEVQPDNMLPAIQSIITFADGGYAIVLHPYNELINDIAVVSENP